MIRLSRFAVLTVSLPLALGACRHKAPPVVAPATNNGGTAAAPPRPVDVAPLPPPVVPRDPGMSVPEMRRLVLETVYFEYDTDAIRADAQASLEKRIPILAANPSVKLTVQGNCDERGGDEYNIALGRRRAESVKRFLTDRGIDASRIETVSFGRERPAMQGSTEEAFAKNRRDEFLITAGGDNLKSP